MALSKYEVISTLLTGEQDVEDAFHRLESENTSDLLAQGFFVKFPFKPDRPEKYQYAVHDAMIANEWEKKPLIAISEKTKGLEWKTSTKSGKRFVKVLHWAGNYMWKNTTESERFQTKSRVKIGDDALWVSIPFEVKAFIGDNLQQTKGVAREDRLKQYFGMPLSAEKIGFLEIWVEEKDLFRPTPDREISDDKAELDFRDSDLTFKTKKAIDMTPEEKRDKEHYEWMTKLAKASYLDKDPLHDNPPYPWTRLGYTRDWGNDETAQGASEFCIVPGARVYIASKIKTDDYGL